MKLDFSKVTPTSLVEAVPSIKAISTEDTGATEAFGPEVGPLFWPFVIDQVITFVKWTTDDTIEGSGEAFLELVGFGEKHFLHVSGCEDCVAKISPRFPAHPIDIWTEADWIYYTAFLSIVTSDSIMETVVEEFQLEHAPELLKFWGDSEDPDKMRRALTLGIMMLQSMASDPV